MGEAAIGWTDLDAWQRNTGVELEPWEARTIRDMSSAFISQCYKSRKPDCPAPYTGSQEQVEDARGKVANQVKALFGGLKKA